MQRASKVGMSIAGLAGMAGAGWALRQLTGSGKASENGRLRQLGARINVDRWGASGRKRKA